MGRRSAQESRLTRQRLIDAALEVFASEGTTRATLESIGRLAGYSRGAVHWYFPDRKVLLQAVLDQHQLPLEAFLSSAELEAGIDQLLLALEQTISSREARNLCRILLGGSEDYQHQVLLGRRLGQIQERFQTQIVSLLTLIEASGARPDADWIHDATQFLRVFMTGLIFESLKSAKPPSSHVELFEKALASIVRLPRGPAC